MRRGHDLGHGRLAPLRVIIVFRSITMSHDSTLEGGLKPFDPVSERLLRARTIIISGEITQQLAATVSAQLVALAAESEAEITVFVNSQGGHVEAGDTIHDLVRFIRAPVRM